MRPGSTSLVASSLSILAAACGGGSSGADAPVGAPGGAADELAVTTPATWLYHPREAPTPTASLPLGDGRCVVATEEGERWLVPTTSGSRCAGASLGAAPGAPEPLRRVVRDGAAIRFVGESGALYEAREPLGAFTRVLVPPEPLGRVATRGDVTIGLSSAGAPYLLDGEGWTRGDAGGARLFDVEVDDGGRALALAWPERVLASTDRGRTFRPVTPAPAPIGAIAVHAAADGSLGVAGVHGQLTWSTAGALTPATRRPEPDAGDAVAEVIPAAIAPEATALIGGRAALAGRRWFEARLAGDLPEDDEAEPREGWFLVRGRLGGGFDAVPLAGVDEEREVRLAAHGRTVVVASVGEPAEGDEGARLVVRRSVDEGTSFVEIARVVAPDVRHVRLAVSAAGDVLVAGACAGERRPAGEPAGERDDLRVEAGDGLRDEEGPCRPRAPVLLRPGARPPATTTVVGGMASELRGAATGPAFSPDGALAYFVGRRAKGQEPSIFVSDDGARSWSARPMRRRSAGDGDHAHLEAEAWEDEPREDRDEAIELMPEHPLTVDAEGTLGFAIQTPRAQAWVVADADGEVRGIHEVPEANALAAGSGRRALAVAQTGEDLETWETRDGGATWTPAGSLRARMSGDLGLACSPGGCVVGDGLTRVGWEPRDEPPVATPPRTPAGPPSLRTPLVCELDPRGWLALPSIEQSAPFPSIDEIARGRAAWSVLGVDRARGAATVHHVPLEGDGRITARAILDPTPRDAPSAMRVSHQGEGYAVARAIDGAREIEVGWVNFFEGVFGRRSAPLPAGEAPRTSSDGGPHALETGLVSVATGGILVQPVARERVATFLDVKGGGTRVELPDWGKSGVVGRVRDDAARVGGRTVFVGVLDAGAAVGLLGVRADGGALAVQATTLAPPGAIGAASMTSWTYAGGAPGFLVVAADPSGDGWSTAVWRAFGADGTLGPPVAAPTLPDLPDRPRPCRAEEVKQTPRTESHLTVPGQAQVLARGQRHPVIIPGAGDASAPDGVLHLLTAGAVLHGTPSSPCLAGWEATGVDGRRAAAVILGDLARAWVFRIAPAPPASLLLPSPGRAPDGTVNVEVRAMTCRWDPGAPIPEGVWDEVGVR